MVDMSKAFDRVQHERLVIDLHSLGFHGKVLEWLVSYLSGRHQRIKVGAELSPETACSRGVPQGSVLGPLLFVLYTRAISDILPAAIAHQEFADDIVIEFSHANVALVVQFLSNAVTALAEWLGDIRLLLNKKKTQVMFLKPRGQQDPVDRVCCNGDELATVSSAKYLGVIFDDDLSWRVS
eukprot:scpid60792/ scgid22286/ Putative uncharacterized transposon-derived protein ZK1236.4